MVTRIRKDSVVRNKYSLPLSRFFTKKDIHPFDEVRWVKYDAEVGGFEQKETEFPDFWSENAVNITASKYFRGKLGTPERETSLRQVIKRVAKTIREWGEKLKYFSGSAQAQIFEDELTHLLLYQKGSFNSPVWFNVGVKEKPQCSACFILSVEDDMNSILDWIRTEGIVFKGGSGAGINLSNLRSKKEFLSGGGASSGPVSFMRGADSVAGMIKSGGTTRRAAKMVILNIDHPDIVEFIRCKADEEKKVKALIDAGFDMSDLNNDAWTSVQFQNANNSVRITNDFMKAVETDGEWRTRFRVSGASADTYRAHDLLNEIAQAAWESGDPGVQFDTIINDWHTCPNSGRINASNPCSEYMHLDNSACNLASLNLLKFLTDEGNLDIKAFKQAVDIFILAQEIIVDGSSYPTQKITKNAHDFRELGLGFANLGALLMTKSLPYDSDGGRSWAGAITSLMSGEAYRFSAEIARRMGPFKGFSVNREPMLRVIGKHGVAAQVIDGSVLDDKILLKEAQGVWQKTLTLGKENGFRNSQVTVIAPTGTIAFMMDCDTTGVEPDFSLVKMKQLVGGGWMKIVNTSVKRSLLSLGYGEDVSDEIVSWIYEKGTVEGAPQLKEEHLSIFDCAVRPAAGTRSISWKGHVKMVAAVQPFISGAISKTFNMGAETTKDEIAEAYLMAWKVGIKAFAVYRDGSKAAQPLSTSAKKRGKESGKKEISVVRRHLPPTRHSETHKFSIVGHEGYLTYSTFGDGSPAEIFIRMAKQGSTLAGLLDAFAISVSMALQYGVPFKNLARKFIYSRFEPSGFTKNPDIRVATSIVDYIFRYLALRFLATDDLIDLGMSPALENGGSAKASEILKEIAEPVKVTVGNGDSNKNNQPDSLDKEENIVSGDSVCRNCGGMMVRTGTCMTCLQCGASSGGCS
ncbi:ribonucleoside-diphosphate reductase, adenosylcobalamin-dependent [Candidatus Wolfebacteria bacterium GWA1_42_9]|uniref:Vitamin B12-dependent ribonucleotide reductase n=1 Tax=Candidatus Wolfebacteria bacterium GWA1_42_9 TaxID=1802553 RepID=A0A1F8DMA5_9BACT|nr:MAG: ribonucleoside-diphosphate reductase, adenosylcobalamin-dependent [Candidatus Wolfebacteria bacterium GWA1_42_9]